MASSHYTCNRHSKKVPAGTACPKCLTAFLNRRDAATMTPKERAAELKWWCADSIVTIPFADIHERINELVGRPVWTHEIPGLDQLVAEILSQEEATLTDVLGKFSPGKPIVVVDMSDGS